MRYSSSGRQYSLAIHEDAEADLEQIFAEDEDAAAEILVFLEEAKLNQKTLENLTIDGYVHHENVTYNVKEIKAAKRARYRYNLWRLRLLWIEGGASKYRIIYAFSAIEYRYYVLAIVPRNIAYEMNKHERTAKIFAAYDDLQIPRY